MFDILDNASRYVLPETLVYNKNDTILFDFYFLNKNQPHFHQRFQCQCFQKKFKVIAWNCRSVQELWDSIDDIDHL